MKRTYLTPMLFERLTLIQSISGHARTLEDAAAHMGITDAAMRSTLARLFTDATWPPVIDPRLFELPIKTPDVPTNGGVRKKQSSKEYAEIARRVAADQARLKAERDKWLEIEREKYGLKKRGKSIDDMAA